ncbi:(2Fe-2S)-binding protein [Bacteroidota bacterium]
MKKAINFILNGTKTKIVIDPSKRLVDLLREDFKLTGTKEGCSIGECGACTILFNKKAVNSCLLLAGQIDGAEIITIEGMNNDKKMNIIQGKFIEFGAIQCGYCTPGMIISSYALLELNSDPNEDDIKDALEGNLCRCTGYKQIIEALKSAVLELNVLNDNSS